MNLWVLDVVKTTMMISGCNLDYINVPRSLTQKEKLSKVRILLLT